MGGVSAGSSMVKDWRDSPGWLLRRLPNIESTDLLMLLLHIVQDATGNIARCFGLAQLDCRLDRRIGRRCVRRALARARGNLAAALVLWRDLTRQFST